MSSVWDRRNRRISYQVPVGLLDLRAERVLNTSSINVSRGGMFVDTNENLLIGAQLVCNVPYGRDQEAMQLRGRVAWLRSANTAAPDRPPGVGIEFVDLSDEQSDKLSVIVGGNEEESHQLSLKLPGLASPVRGKAFLTPKGVFFRSKLPFLALDSDVEFVFEDEDDDLVYDGRIVGVDVLSDRGSPVPRLQVEIAVKEEEMPSPTDIPTGESGGHEYEMLHIDTDDTEKTMPPTLHEDILVEIPQMLPIVIAEQEDSGAVRAPIVFELTEKVMPLALPVARKWAPAALLVGCILGILAFALSGDDASKAPVAESASAAAASDAPSDTSAEMPVIHYSKPSPEGTEAQEAAARIRKVALAEQDELGDYHEEPPAIAPAPKTTRAISDSPGEGAQETIGGVKIWTDDGQLVMRLPIKGSLERAANYPLADPPGLAINLPYAQPKAGFHSSLSPHNEQLRTLWVRERLGGLHFRVFFEAQAESCAVTYNDSAVIIRCRF